MSAVLQNWQQVYNYSEAAKFFKWGTYSNMKSHEFSGAQTKKNEKRKRGGNQNVWMYLKYVMHSKSRVVN